MRKAFIGLLILLLCSLVHSAYGATSVSGRPCPGGAVSYQCTDATHDSTNNAITLCEDIEGEVDCDAGAGTQNFCRNSWTLVGTPVFNTSGIEGTYSVGVDNSSEAQSFSKTITTADNYYIFLKIKVVALPTTATRVLSKLSSSWTTRGWISITTSGALYVANGTVNATTAGKMSAGNTYYIWWGYTKGTGTDGTGYVAFSSTTTKPTSGNNYASITTGDANSQITTVQFGVGSVNPVNVILDHIRINTSDFGDNPL